MSDINNHVLYNNMFKINVDKLTQMILDLNKEKIEIFFRDIIISSVFIAVFQTCFHLDGDIMKDCSHLKRIFKLLMNIASKELNVEPKVILDMIDDTSVNKTIAFLDVSQTYPRLARCFFNPFREYVLNLQNVFEKPSKLDWRYFWIRQPEHDLKSDVFNTKDQRSKTPNFWPNETGTKSKFDHPPSYNDRLASAPGWEEAIGNSKKGADYYMFGSGRHDKSCGKGRDKSRDKSLDKSHDKVYSQGYDKGPDKSDKPDKGFSKHDPSKSDENKDKKSHDIMAHLMTIQVTLTMMGVTVVLIMKITMIMIMIIGIV